MVKVSHFNNYYCLDNIINTFYYGGYLANRSTYSWRRWGGVLLYLPSIIFDRDVDFFNNYSVIYKYKKGEVNKYGYRKETKTGYSDNPWAIGPAVSLSPFYLTAHYIAKQAIIGLVGIFEMMGMEKSIQYLL